MHKILREKINNLISDEKFSEILTGSVWALAARMLSAGLALVTSIMIARIYGAEMVGILAVIQVFLMFASMVTVLGTDTSILRLIPEHISKYSTTSAFKVYRKTQYFVGAFSILTGGLFFFASDLIAVKVFTKPNLSFFLALASGFVVFRSLMELNTQAVRGLRLIRAFALMQVFPSAVILVFLIVITVFHGGHNSPVYAHMLAWAVTALVGVWLVNRFFQKLMLPEDM
ncbi:MAG: oligosaccharide flippase family protein, partial [Gammaproteobacteria bacterium]|nr:oligosaccharide flippase family protein [Gammaproteobacteria bacterium]